MRQINILSSNKLYRKYSFDYYTENCHLEPKLKSIDVESGDGTKLNPTNILWTKDGDKHIKYGEEYSINIKDIDPWRIFEDFDGDGKKDVISINKNNNTFTLFLNTDIYNNVSFLKKKTVSIYGDQLQDVFCADLDGDSFVDVICVVKAPNGTFRYNYYFYDGDSFVMKGGFNAQAVNNDYLIGDFNGNGRNDIAIRSMKSFFDYRGEKFGNIDINWGKEFASFFPNNLSLLDFNGNSKADIITRDDSKAYVYELTNGNMSLSLRVKALKSLIFQI